MDESALFEARSLVARVGKIMLDRNLTDLAGGNISVRVDNRVLMSPSYAGTRKFWELTPADVLVLDLNGNLLEGNGKISREAPVHLKLLNSFYPGGSAVIHSHARNIMVFCAACRPIPPVLEYSYKFGEIKVVEYARGGTQSRQLAENIYMGLLGQETRIGKQAAAVIAPWHGLFAVGKDLYATLDAVERIEINARCILLAASLPDGAKGLEQSCADLSNTMKPVEGDDE